MPEILTHTDETLDPRTLEVVAQEFTSQWRHRIELKDLMADETTHEVVDNLCKRIVARLDAMIECETRWQDKADADETTWYLSRMRKLRGEFDCLIGDDMDVDDLENEFNYRLDDLYDFGDTKIRLKKGLQKFCWINTF